MFKSRLNENIVKLCKVPTVTDEYMVSTSYILTVLSSRKRTLHVYEWAVPQPKGVVYIQHGFRSHARTICVNKIIPDVYKCVIKDIYDELREKMGQDIGRGVPEGASVEPSPYEGVSFYTPTSDELNLIEGEGLPAKMRFSGGVADQLNKQGYTVRAMDLYGHGQSHKNSPMPSCQLDCHVDDILSMIEAFHRRDRVAAEADKENRPDKGTVGPDSDYTPLPFCIVGISMGAYLAHKMSLLHAASLEEMGLRGVLHVGGMFDIQAFKIMYFPVLYVIFHVISFFSDMLLKVMIPQKEEVARLPWKQSSDYYDPLIILDIPISYTLEMIKGIYTIFKQTLTIDNLKAFRRLNILLIHNANDYSCGVGGVIKVKRQLESLGHRLYKVVIMNPFLARSRGDKRNQESTIHMTNQCDIVSDEAYEGIKECTHLNGPVGGHNLLDDPSSTVIMRRYVLPWVNTCIGDGKIKG